MLQIIAEGGTRPGGPVWSPVGLLFTNVAVCVAINGAIAMLRGSLEKCRGAVLVSTIRNNDGYCPPGPALSRRGTGSA